MRKGFTLIELLVVIAIIAILAAILFPVFLSSRQKAQQTKCLGNMRQIGMAMMMYSDDWDSVLPGQTYYWIPPYTSEFPGPGDWYRDGVMAKNSSKGGWLMEILPYTKGTRVFRCPVLQIWNKGVPAISGTEVSYLMTGYANHKKRSAILRPGKAVAVWEQGASNRWSLVDPWTETPPYWGGYSFSEVMSWHKFHADGMNVVFCDGHARWVHYLNMTEQMFGASR